MNKLKKVTILFLISILTVISLIGSCACQKEVVLTETETTFINLINEARIQNNLNPLVPSQNLMDLAKSRSGDMIARNYFSHYSPEGNRVGCGENLAECNLDITPEMILNAWLNSPTHRDNILYPIYKNIGIGIAGNNDTRIVTILFSSR